MDLSKKAIALFWAYGAEMSTEGVLHRCGAKLACMHWVLLLAAITTSTTAQVLLKAGASARTLAVQLLRWQTCLGLGLYGLAAILYIVALRKIPLSVALPCTALSYVALALIGHFLFGEGLGVQKGVALALIAAGVVVLAASPG